MGNGQGPIESRPQRGFQWLHSLARKQHQYSLIKLLISDGS